MSDGDNLIFTQGDLAQNGFPIMEEIRRMGKLCDVTLKVRTLHIILSVMMIFISHIMFIPVNNSS